MIASLEAGAQVVKLTVSGRLRSWSKARNELTWAQSGYGRPPMPGMELPPNTKIGVGPKVTTAREEADAARKALELVPGLPAAEEMLRKL